MYGRQRDPPENIMPTSKENFTVEVEAVTQYINSRLLSIITTNLAKVNELNYNFQNGTNFYGRRLS